jgi:hypothetical protein
MHRSSSFWPECIEPRSLVQQAQTAISQYSWHAQILLFLARMYRAPLLSTASTDCHFPVQLACTDPHLSARRYRAPLFLSTVGTECHIPVQLAYTDPHLSARRYRAPPPVQLACALYRYPSLPIRKLSPYAGGTADPPSPHGMEIRYILHDTASKKLTFLTVYCTSTCTEKDRHLPTQMNGL